MPVASTFDVLTSARRRAGRMADHVPLTPDELQRVSTGTLAHYERAAAEFWEGTQHHDVSQNYTALFVLLMGSYFFWNQTKEAR